MKIKEFVETAAKVTNTKIIEGMIELKPYVPFTQKKELAKKIVEKSKVVEHGYVRIDEMQRYLIFVVEVLKTYTNLEFSDDPEEMSAEYDMLVQNGILATVIGMFTEEYEVILSLTDMEVAYILNENSTSYQLSRFLNVLDERLGNVLQSVTNKVNSFDLDSLGIGVEELKQLGELLGIK